MLYFQQFLVAQKISKICNYFASIKVLWDIIHSFLKYLINIVVLKIDMKVENIEFNTKEIGDTAKEFLEHKRMAFVGLSSDPKHFSRMVLPEFLNRGYQVVGIKPDYQEIAGVKCYNSFDNLGEEIDFVLIMINKEKSIDIVKQAHAKGINRIWFHRGAGPGSVSEESLQYCLDNGIKVIPGFCPYMILPDVPFFHKFHHWILKFKKAFPIM